MDARIPMDKSSSNGSMDIQDINYWIPTTNSHEQSGVFVRNPGDEPKLPKVAVKVQKDAEIFGAAGVKMVGIPKMNPKSYPP